LIEPTRIVGLYTRPQAAIVVVAWEARIVGGEARPTPESLEVRPFRPNEIPWPQIHFQTTHAALRDWLRQRGEDR
ncbi:MAG: NUDIX hydrolase, partial [Chloroflexota bacterium]|nr:NUDIX hydrolase [Chloroflexota bacterium]